MRKLTIMLCVITLLFSAALFTEAATQPEDNVTRDEILDLAAATFNLSPVDHQALAKWLTQEYPEESFVTRGELVALAGHLLDLSAESISGEGWEPSYADIDTSHPLFTAIEFISNLNVLPIYTENYFEPDRLTTQAEVGATFEALTHVETVNGLVVEVRQPANWIIINAGNDQFRYLPVEDGTIIVKNGQTRQIAEIKAGDELNAIYDIYGGVALINVTPAMADNNLLENVAGLIQGLRNITSPQELASPENLRALQQILTPEQIAALISGDWNGLSTGFRQNLSSQLVDFGLTPWETEALLTQDWRSLQNMGIDRAALMASDYFGVTPEIFYSVVNQNWEQLLEYAQIEIAQRLLAGIKI